MLGTLLGTALGLLMGYLGGVLDILVGRVVEAVLALPVVVVAFLFVVALGPSAPTLIVVIGFVFTPLIARTVRSAVLVESQLDYLSSARLLGEKSGQIMFAEILPNVVPVILVEFTVRLGYAIFAVATLSFLGFGVQPPTPDWGADIAANYGVLPAGYWWETLFPALAIASLIVAHQPGHRLDRAGAGLVTAADTTAAPGAAGGTAPALAVEHMDVTYRVRGQDRRALRDVSFEIGHGESYGLVGESGSGKSTVALALTRYLPRNGRVSAGTISINGHGPAGHGRRRRCATCGPTRCPWSTRSPGGR